MTSTESLTSEAVIAHFVVTHVLKDVPEDVLNTVKNITLAVVGTSVAGSGEEGVSQLRDMLLDQGGKPEATVIVFGDRLPAASAALLNSVMARALDYCDAMVPGAHFGSSVVPAALAAAEIAGGISGRDFLTALTVGFEVGSRFNLPEQSYGGRDPTGIAGMFASTAAVARILGLDERQTLNALALAFNRCGGSMQSNVDASLAVRLIQGWVTEASINCALLARRGFTGPANFLDGVFGYSRLFAGGMLRGKDFTDGLGERYVLQQTMFKRYPSCGLTQGVTDLALQIASEAGVTTDTLVSAEIHLPTYAFRIVGGPFRLGNTPRVNAQFSAQFCAANAWARGSSKLTHFRNEVVSDPRVLKLNERIRVVEDKSMDSLHQTAVRLIASTADSTYEKFIEVSPGFPPNNLSESEHLVRFSDCMLYAAKPLSAAQVQKLPRLIAGMEDLVDVRELLAEMIVRII